VEKNIVERGRPQMTIWRMRIAYRRLQIHIIRLCNTHGFSTTRMVERKRFIVKLYAHWLSCTFFVAAEENCQL